MTDLEKLVKKADELAAELGKVNDEIEATKNPTEFNKLPIGKVCLVL